MPHLHITHTAGVSADIPAVLKAMHDTLTAQGFGSPSIKGYTVEVKHAFINGQAGGDMAHLNFRLLDKKERTPEVLTAWLSDLRDAMVAHLPADCSITFETHSLPPLYFTHQR